MAAALKAGTVYFIAVFLLGFALGTFRVLVMAPTMGNVRATVVELPLMLLASWFSSAWSIRRFQVSTDLGARGTMGAVAFAMLIAAETILGVVGFNRTIEQQLAVYRETGPMLGLMAQIVFALFPIIQSALNSKRKLPHES